MKVIMRIELESNILQQPEQKLHVKYFPAPEGAVEETVIEVTGELHLPNADQFQKQIQTILESHGGNVLLDFRQVGFIDSAGLKVVLDTRKQLSLQSRSLSIYLCAGTQPDRVLCTSGLSMIVTLRYE